MIYDFIGLGGINRGRRIIGNGDIECPKNIFCHIKNWFFACKEACLHTFTHLLLEQDPFFGGEHIFLGHPILLNMV